MRITAYVPLNQRHLKNTLGCCFGLLGGLVSRLLCWAGLFVGGARSRTAPLKKDAQVVFAVPYFNCTAFLRQAFPFRFIDIITAACGICNRLTKSQTLLLRLHFATFRDRNSIEFFSCAFALDPLATSGTQHLVA